GRGDAGATSSPAAPDTTQAAAPAASPAETRAARKEIARVERRLARIADEEQDLHAKMAADPTDYAGVAALDARLRELAAEKEELEMAWLEAAEVAG
ncbi:ABC transporter ATP-binding protein, partial [Isoptericola cucumis]